jgi:poly-gamma-glutamate synthesis protein (capsule biosynthesis protein)
MVETYRFFIEAGADAVVNHHQHCICGYEVYKGKPIFYGLGNFCFDWAKRSTSL